jgi:biopolymer transport protein ExbD
MTKRQPRNRSARNVVNCDLELRPLMNVFIVLIPMLLMSAVFMEIRVIEMSLPRAVAATAAAQATVPLELSIHILGTSYVIEGRGLPPLTFARDASHGVAGTPGRNTSLQLAAALTQIAAEHPGNKEIRIVAESRTHYQEIVSLMDLARAAGLPDAALEGAKEGV